MQNHHTLDARRSRRRGLAPIAVLAAAGLTTGNVAPACAQAGGAWPAKPPRLVVPFAPGGAADMVGRLVTQKMGEALGQQFVVENRGGGGTLIGTELVARAPADGYTVLLITPSFTINAALRKLPYDPLGDFAPVSQIGSTPLVMVVHPSLPVHSVRELLALARSRPNEIAFGSAGSGSPTHLGMELLRGTGAKMTHVPYKGAAPAATDLVGGHTQLMLTSVILAQQYVKAGRLRAIAVTTTKRSPTLPDVPAIAETVPGYEVVNWWGLVAPAGTPQAVIDRIQGATAKAVRLPDVTTRLERVAAEPVGGPADAFGRLLRDEIAKWKRVIAEIGMKPE